MNQFLRNPWQRGVLLTALLLLPLWLATPVAQALSAGVFQDLIRDTARVGEDVPLQRTDEVATALAKSGASHAAVDAELRAAGTAGGVTKGTDHAAEVLERLRQVAAGLPDAERVVQRLEQLDAASRETALVVMRGGRNLVDVVPDIARRGRLLRAGGPEMVAAVGLHGPEAAEAALRLDEALQAGTLLVRPGQHAVSLVDFGRVMMRTGESSWDFWKTYVQPHWKAWLTTGALAAYLYDPQGFQDKAGQLTEEGFRRLVVFAGSEVAAAIRGLGHGSTQASITVWDSLRQTYLGGAHPILAWVGTAVFTVILLGILRLVFGGWLRGLIAGWKAMRSGAVHKRG